MKRIGIIISLIIFFGSINVFASTKVYTRTDQNYLVPDDVIITESNKSNIMSTPAIDASEKIYDFGNLLTDSEEDKLYTQIKKFIDGASLDFAIVTISDNVKNSSKDYAHDFYDYNMFDNDGILFLIDMDNRSIYMSTNGTAVSLFPDSRMEPILENVYGKVSQKKYYDACLSFTTSISEFIELGDSDYNEDVVINDDGTITKNLHLLEVFLFALIGTIIIIVILIMMNRMVSKATLAKEFLNKETMKINDISEVFLGSHTSKTLIADDSSNMTSKGSSGQNHGGKGHKF